MTLTLTNMLKDLQCLDHQTSLGNHGKPSLVVKALDRDSGPLDSIPYSDRFLGRVPLLCLLLIHKMGICSPLLLWFIVRFSERGLSLPALVYTVLNPPGSAATK